VTEEPKEPVQPAQTQEPTQSPEDVMKRMAGIPKTPEELEAEREAMEKERLERGRVPGPLGQTGEETEPKPVPAEQQTQPQQQPPPPPATTTP